MQHCLKPLWMLNVSESCHCSIRVTDEGLDHALQFGRTTDVWENLEEAASVEQIRSNTLARSMTAISKGINFLAVLPMYFSCSCRREKTMTTVYLSALVKWSVK